MQLELKTVVRHLSQHDGSASVVSRQAKGLKASGSSRTSASPDHSTTGRKNP